ncbi:MAG: PAS domain S-box protein [Planctomycetia bacterium]|nr:PAS domain S-box protein [Planctomycetia bacterium]
MASDTAPSASIARQLQRSQERLQSILDTAYSAYVAIDEQGLIIDWNRQAEATFGYPREEALGRALAHMIIPPPYRGRHLAGLQRFLATGQGPVFNRRLEMEARHRDGHEFPVDLTIWHLRDEHGWTFHALVHDATELREAQRLAMAAERQAAAGQLITLLAQESRNPLQQIEMWSEMLSLEVQECPTARAAVAEIQKAQQRLVQLLTDVRGYAAPLQLTPQMVNLAEVWREAWHEVTQLPCDRAAELFEDADAVDLWCRVDPEAAEQLFHHVLRSAIARAGEPAEICIACFDDTSGRPSLRVAVRDNGRPLSDEERRQLEVHNGSQPGEPNAEAESEDFSMAIAARIVEAHGGRIAAGTGQWAGGEVVIVLPRAGGSAT